MSDGPEWFAAKRYGYGASLPISWQGWVVMIAILVPAIVALLVITARTTRGGWRWRWGEDD